MCVCLYVCVCACACLRVSRAATRICTCTCMLDSTYEGGAVPSSGGSRNGAMGGRLVGGAAGGGVHPLASKGVRGSAVSSPIGAWGGAPEAFTFFASNPAKNQRIRSAANF